jgi:hypothetical protein
MDQRELEKGEGPIAVICAPTRELADQIYQETKKYTKGQGLKYELPLISLLKNIPLNKYFLFSFWKGWLQFMEGFRKEISSKS